MALQRQPGSRTSRPATCPLHICPDCDSNLVYPLGWTEAGQERWKVEVRCPNCESVRSGTFDQEAVDAFDVELDGGVEALMRDLSELSRANMAADVDRFAAALHAGAILPEDF